MNPFEPMDILRQAHEVALEKLELLSDAASGLDTGGNSTALGTLKEVLQFINGEIKVHMRYEEEALFPALARVIGREGPIMVMLDEHQSLWQAVDTLGQKIAQLESASADNGPKIAKEVKLVADHIVGLLGSHIEKENGILFPMAEQTLSAQTMREIAEQMRAVGQAV